MLFDLDKCRSIPCCERFRLVGEQQSGTNLANVQFLAQMQHLNVLVRVLRQLLLRLGPCEFLFDDVGCLLDELFKSASSLP